MQAYAIPAQTPGQRGSPRCRRGMQARATPRLPHLPARDGGGVDARAADDDDAGEADRLASKIEFSCVQTIACTPPPGNAAPSGAVSRCIESTTEVLAAQPELLDAYLQAFAECDAFVACDYVECSNRRQ